MSLANWMDPDGKLILVEKAVRTIPYGFLGVLFAVYLSQLGFSSLLIGVVLTATVFSSALYTFSVSFVADRIGRRRTLVFFALMDFIAGSFLFISTTWWAPVLAGIVGNMTVGAGEVGPFLSLEQAVIPRTCDSQHRTLAFSWYNLVGYASSSVGALIAGLPQYFGSGPSAYRPLFAAYLVSGLVGSVLYSKLSKGIEIQRTTTPVKRAILSEKSKPIVQKLSALFAIDAFGGGFIGTSILSYYFYERFALQLTSLGLIFSATQIVTAMSFLAAERIARRIGLLRTMVFSHIPSNVFLIAVPFAPSAFGAIFLLLCRQSLSQMDVPTRQSYVMAVVDEDDRTPAAGFTNVTRSVAQSVSPLVAGYAIATLWIGSIFVAAGTLKLAYDVLIYRSFRRIKPPEENRPHCT
ncbi:MAG: MFS transporter [Candidatus Bathyarchaeia archaeon]